MNDDLTSAAEERFRDTDTASRVRAVLLLLLGALVVVWVFSQGLTVYGRLPERMPMHFGAGGLPDAWGHKTPFAALGLVMIAGVELIGITLLRARPQWFNFPGKEKALALPPARRAHVYAPLQESMAWLASGIAIGLSLLCQQTWAVALNEREGISPVLLLGPVVIGIGAVVIGAIASTRRVRALAE